MLSALGLRVSSRYVRRRRAGFFAESEAPGEDRATDSISKDVDAPSWAALGPGPDKIALRMTSRCATQHQHQHEQQCKKLYQKHPTARKQQSRFKEYFEEY